MVFLNAILLFGTIAASVPLIIHLLNRSKVRIVPWAAMQFLTENVDQKSRRIKWQQWLLLAIRCSIPLVLSLLMARPAVDWLYARLLPNAATAYLVVDESPSMLAMDIASNNAVLSVDHPAIVAIHSIVESAGVSDLKPRLFATSGSAVDTVPTDGTDFSHDQLTELYRYPVQTLKSQLARVQNFVRQEPNKPHRFLVVSDFQSSMLADWDMPERSSLRSSLANAAAPQELIFIPTFSLQPEARQLANSAIQFDQQNPAVVGPQQATQLAFVVTNDGDKAIEDASINFSVDGKAVSNQRVTVLAGQSERRIVTVPPLEAGDHLCQLKIDAVDALAVDNAASWIIRSIPPTPILLLFSRSDDANALALQNSSLYLQYALSPPEYTSDGKMTFLPRLFEVVGPVEASEVHTIDQALQRGVSHVVLCNVRRLDDALWTRIVERTRSGSICVLAGDQADTAWYNQHLSQLVGLEKDTAWLQQHDDAGSQDTSSATVAWVPNTTTAVLRSMSGVLGDVVDVTVSKPWTFDAADDLKKLSDSGASYDVLGAVEDKPVAIYVKAPQCNLTLFSFDLAPDQTNFPLSDSFVPFVQEYFRGLALESKKPLNLPMTNDFDQAVWKLATSSRLPNKSIDLMNRTLESNEASGRQIATLQIPRIESDLTIADRATAERFVNDVGGTLFTREASAATDDDSKSEMSSRVSEIWRYFLLGLLTLLFAEIFLQQYLSRGAN